MATFPRAGRENPKADDPMMKRVDLDRGEIGSRRSGMPDSMSDRSMRLEHVGKGGKGN